MNEKELKVKETLIKIDFLSRFETLSEEHRKITVNEILRHPDWREVKRIIEDLGYKTKYDSREKFFKTEKEVINDVTYFMHLSVGSGIIEIIWIAEDEHECFLGSPLICYSQEFFDMDDLLKGPLISSYEDIKDILKIIFEMFEDFKREFSALN